MPKYARAYENMPQTQNKSLSFKIDGEGLKQIE
jgi:hypothetical protein